VPRQFVGGKSGASSRESVRYRFMNFRGFQTNSRCCIVVDGPDFGRAQGIATQAALVDVKLV
jgi:hypothetical protein